MARRRRSGLGRLGFSLLEVVAAVTVLSLAGLGVTNLMRLARSSALDMQYAAAALDVASNLADQMYYEYMPSEWASASTVTLPYTYDNSTFTNITINVGSATWPAWTSDQVITVPNTSIGSVTMQFRINRRQSAGARNSVFKTSTALVSSDTYVMYELDYQWKNSRGGWTTYSIPITCTRYLYP